MDQARRSAARMYADDQAVKAQGISIEDVAPGRATARMRVSADMVNGHGMAHGGYVFLLADTAFAYAASTMSASARPAGRCWPSCAGTAGHCGQQERGRPGAAGDP